MIIISDYTLVLKEDFGIFVESSETSHMCPICHSYHTELPDCLVPYKHYEAEVISGVLDEVVRPENLDSEDYPSFSTMRRWMQWFVENLTRIEGYLRTAGFHLLACGRDILFQKFPCSMQSVKAFRLAGTYPASNL